MTVERNTTEIRQTISNKLKAAMKLFNIPTMKQKLMVTVVTLFKQPLNNLGYTIRLQSVRKICKQLIRDTSAINLKVTGCLINTNDRFQYYKNRQTCTNIVKKLVAGNIVNILCSCHGVYIVNGIVDVFCCVKYLLLDNRDCTVFIIRFIRSCKC